MSIEYEKPPALRRSDALHKRVRQFAHDSCNVGGNLQAESFERLALDLARFQFEQSPGFARLCPDGPPSRLEAVPLVPSDVFRLTRVALHPPEMDVAVYKTSGTTAALTGRHPVRDLSTKEELTLLQVERTLTRRYGPGIVVAFAPSPDGSSSLGHLMQLLMEQVDGRTLCAEPDGAAFSVREPGRWLVGAAGVELEGLRRAARLAKFRSQPLYLLSTAFALAAALEALDGEILPAPRSTRIMMTGGFKGRTHSLSETELRAAAARTFAIDESDVVGEYGMTELSSQLFEQRTLETAHHGAVDLVRGDPSWQGTSRAGVYFAPPWLRVRVVDPASYRPLPQGEAGLAHFVDLANVDSCLSVVTQDIVRAVDGGIELLGRAPRAESRGCSLPFETYVSDGASWESSL